MHTPKYGSRTKIEVLVDDRIYNDLVNELLKKLTRGSVSDGKIFVYDVSQAYDIGSGEKNESAIWKIYILTILEIFKYACPILYLYDWI